MSSLSNWTNGNDAPVCADQSPYPTWNEWDASQRDLFILNHEGSLVFHENVTGGIPNNLELIIMDLVDQIPDNCDPDLACGQAITCCDGLLYSTTCCSENCDKPIGECADCDPDLMCGEAETCCDGMLYPTTCCSENCDEPIGECGECTDGDINNDNPCNPMECWDGQWYEIIIDCPEGMGIPCEGGVYIPPAEGECCSICILLGDLSGDGMVNVLDVVAMVNLVLSGGYDEVADMNYDGTLNVLDIVSLVNIILG